MTEFEVAAIEAAMALLYKAIVEKKISPEDVTKQIQDMIWKAVREEV